MTNSSETEHSRLSKELEDPLLSFNFGLEIEGLLEGFFMECNGLQSERQVEEYKEGGENGFIHKLPGQVKYSNVTLKRGVTSSNELWQWYEQGRENGQIVRKNASIILFDPAGSTLKRWELAAAFPVKWSGPDLKSDNSQLAVETIELTHHGFTVVK
jgi:phage tail-like protein